MRKATVGLVSIAILGLMLVPGSAQALTTITVQDGIGDVGIALDMHAGTVKDTMSPNAPLEKVGYFDMVSVWLYQKGKTFTFGMELAADLPAEGTPLPNMVRTAKWGMWVDQVPYVVDPWAMPVALIALQYDGVSYAASVLDYSTGTQTSIPFTVDGSKVRMEFSAAMFGNAGMSWLCPAVQIWLGLYGAAIIDSVDPGSVAGQVGFDLPWPPV